MVSSLTSQCDTGLAVAEKNGETAHPSWILTATILASSLWIGSGLAAASALVTFASLGRNDSVPRR